ncbi:MAG: hypothetical protein ACON5B_04165 [Myxococcota bacterium]
MTDSLMMVLIGLGGLVVFAAMALRIARFAVGAAILTFALFVAYYAIVDTAPEPIADTMQSAGEVLQRVTEEAKVTTEALVEDATKEVTKEAKKLEKKGSKQLQTTTKAAKKLQRQADRDVDRAVDQLLEDLNERSVITEE